MRPGIPQLPSSCKECASRPDPPDLSPGPKLAPNQPAHLLPHTTNQTWSHPPTTLSKEVAMKLSTSPNTPLRSIRWAAAPASLPKPPTWRYPPSLAACLPTPLCSRMRCPLQAALASAARAQTSVPPPPQTSDSFPPAGSKTYQQRCSFSEPTRYPACLPTRVTTGVGRRGCGPCCAAWRRQGGREVRCSRMATLI